MSNALQARELFRKYNCNTFFMGQDSFNKDYKEYMSYNIPKERELEWIHEYQGELIQLGELSEDTKFFTDCFTSFCTSKTSYPDITYLDKLLNIIDNKKVMFDSFTKMIIGEGICRIVKSLVNKGNDYNDSVKALQMIAVSLLEEVISNPIILDSSFLIPYENVPDYLHSENIFKRATEAIRIIKFE